MRHRARHVRGKMEEIVSLGRDIDMLTRCSARPSADPWTKPPGVLGTASGVWSIITGHGV